MHSVVFYPRLQLAYRFSGISFPKDSAQWANSSKLRGVLEDFNLPRVSRTPVSIELHATELE